MCEAQMKKKEAGMISRNNANISRGPGAKREKNAFCGFHRRRRGAAAVGGKEVGILRQARKKQSKEWVIPGDRNGERGVYYEESAIREKVKKKEGGPISLMPRLK